ncbi:hypothetical protein ACWD6R_18865 [Streptomyces sp. NPDC005151]
MIRVAAPCHEDAGRRPAEVEALPDGLCRPCRRAADGTAVAPEATTGSTGSTIEPDIRERDVRAHVSELRDLLKVR